MGKIGRSITSSLSVEKIIETVYENVNTLVDATVFAIGIYDKESEQLVLKALKKRVK